MIEGLLAWYTRHAARAYMHLDETAGPVAPPSVVPGRTPLLYIHVPFCRSLCPFCTFHRIRYTDIRSHRYFAALRREIEIYHERGFRFQEVYVGGGTPTSNPGELARTLALVSSLSPVRRVSVETNPSDLTAAITDLLVDAGVNRLSVGVQSFDDEQLRRMERYNAYGSGDEIIRRLQAVQGRFDTVNVDMMFNLPGQTPASLQSDLGILTRSLEVDQVSFYPLMSSPSSRELMRRTMGGGPGHQERDFYYQILDAMSQSYAVSSAWCFSRGTTQLDEYIVDHSDYLGLGSGAFSYIDGVLYSNTFSVYDYQRNLSRDRTGLTASLGLTPAQRRRYEFLMGMFSTRWSKVRNASDHSIERLLELVALRLLGAVRTTPDEYRLTRRGMYYWVVMMREFFNGVNTLREDMRHRVRVDRRRRIPVVLKSSDGSPAID